MDAGHPSTLIVPLTTRVVANAEPLRVRVPPFGCSRQESDLLIDQLRAIDNRRLIRGPLGRLSPTLLRSVAAALREVLDLDVP
jgi:mRNA interferase MazF